MLVRTISTLVLASALMLSACRRGQTPGDDGSGEGSGEREAPPIPVEIATVALGEMPRRLQSTTTLRSADEAAAHALGAGRLTGLSVRVGDTVSAGQVLARIEAPEVALAIDDAERALQEAERTVSELEPLVEPGYIARQQWDEALGRRADAVAAVERARRAVDDLVVLAPLSGVVTARQANPGERVMPGQVVAMIAAVDRLEAVAAFPERDLPLLAAGQHATITAGIAEPIAAAVTRIAPTVDAASGTIDVTVVAPDSGTSLRAGSFVAVEIEVDRHIGVPVVSKRALLWEADEPWVFVVRPGDEGSGEARSGSADDAATVVERVRLSLGYQDATHAEVLSGLVAGDRVVVTGQTGLETGDRVEVVAERTLEGSATGDP